MNYRNPQLRTRLAAEYVSGALRGGARRRFESLMAADATLRREVREWEDQIYPLAMALPPKSPPGRVWRAIRARVKGALPAMPWGWNGVYLWRLFSGALAAMLVLGVTLYPTLVNQAANAQLLAVLQDPALRATLVVRADPDGKVRVRTLENLASVAGDKALELWAIPPGQAPQSMGVIAAAGVTALSKAHKLTGVEVLAITLEQPGGSPDGKPKGPVVMSGKVLEI
jgi:anti-sigma-K factor RskA